MLIEISPLIAAYSRYPYSYIFLLTPGPDDGVGMRHEKLSTEMDTFLQLITYNLQLFLRHLERT